MKFWKYCGICKKTFGSDNIEEFLQMLKDHKCEVAG